MSSITGHFHQRPPILSGQISDTPQEGWRGTTVVNSIALQM